MHRFMTTLSGGRVYSGLPFQPQQVLLADVARSLAMQVRYLGHVSDFYSVAEHSVACVHLAQRLNYPLEVQRACLLHDAHEAYIGDFPSPFKGEVLGLVEFERRFERPTRLAFDLPPEDWDGWGDVKHVDLLDLHRAGEYLKPDWPNVGDPDKALLGRQLIGEPHCYFWQIAELEFLRVAAELGVR